MRGWGENSATSQSEGREHSFRDGQGNGFAESDMWTFSFDYFSVKREGPLLRVCGVLGKPQEAERADGWEMREVLQVS